MKKPPAKSGRRHLDDDEAADWDHTARSIEPLKRAKLRVHKALEVEIDTIARARPKAAEVARSASGPKGASAKEHPPSAQPKATKAAPIAEFDRKKAKKIRSGQIEIEARIDLHGLRQDEAHVMLQAFLVRAQRRGKRWVLVITGKGRIATGRDDDAPFDMTRNRDRGVLKRNVPRWLEEPELRGLVVSYTTAAAAHGGDGALYVHLRKQNQ